MKNNKGFTLIELLVVIAIIGILASVVLASLSSARDKGKDAAVKSQLASMKAQAEIYFAKDETYTGLCNGLQTVNGFGGITGPGLFFAAYSSSGSATTIAVNSAAAQTNLEAVCNDSDLGWAASVPLAISDNTTASFYCSDSTGVSKETTTPLGAGDIVCD